MHITLLALLSAVTVQAGRPLDKSYWTSDELCLTKIRPGNGRGRPMLSTRQFTSTKTVTETVTSTGRNLLPIPLTAPTSINLNDDCTTSTTSIGPTRTIYTGSLEETPVVQQNNLLASDQNAGSFRIRHEYGHAMDSSRQRPYRVDCVLHETVTSTQTVTASESDRCTTTIGSATTTTTQHIKCAPTNLISEVNGHGIESVIGQDSLALAPASDASACCQLCLDTPDCAASDTDLFAGNCFLWFTNLSNQTCGLAIVYSDGGYTTPPGSGFVIQSGCGSVQAA